MVFQDRGALLERVRSAGVPVHVVGRTPGLRSLLAPMVRIRSILSRVRPDVFGRTSESLRWTGSGLPWEI